MQACCNSTFLFPVSAFPWWQFISFGNPTFLLLNAKCKSYQRWLALQICRTNWIHIGFNVKSVTLNVIAFCSVERSAAQTAELLCCCGGLSGTPLSIWISHHKPEKCTSEWQAHAWFESGTQSRPRCEAHHFQRTGSVSNPLLLALSTKTGATRQAVTGWSTFLNSRVERVPLTVASVMGIMAHRRDA